MAAKLKESYAGLERKVEERTAELKASLDQQTAISEILRAISGSPTDVTPVLDAVAMRAARICDATDARIFLVDGEGVRHVAGFGEIGITISPGETLPLNRGSVSGRAILDRTPIHFPDLEQVSQEELPVGRDMQRRSGYRTVLAVPLLREDRALGAIMLRRMEARPFAENQVALLGTFADQAAIAIENVRLFHEIQEKSRQLEIANRHKSEFLANMSHELRTPLNAVIGFSEVLAEKYFGDLTPKQAEYVKDIHASGKHLLSLINDILDLSKIEAGRMELELAEFDMPSALQNALTLVRERAQRHGIALELKTDPALGAFRADERKFKQIMLNLLSNAVKFTPEGGRVGVNAQLNGQGVEIAVTDSGMGIAAADQETIFEEFRQVGSDYTKKAEGTGLGLALAKRFVELHGGTIRVASAPGQGATFTFTLPLRHG
jgi:signal transduction histidine kinase